MRHRDPGVTESIRDYLNRYVRRTGDTPSIRTIAAGTGIPRQTVQRYLSAMGEAGEIEYRGGRIRTPLGEKMQGGTTPVPLLGQVACGLPGYAEEHVETYLPLPDYLTGGADCFLLRARGESMIGVGIEEGDLVLVRAQNTARSGEIAVVLVGEEATLKRYYPEPESHRIRLHPENPQMADLYVPAANVQGVALRVIKELR